MAIDPFLYFGLGAGFVAGRLLPYRGPWVERATTATIVVLVFAFGAALGSVPLGDLLATLPIAATFALLILGIAVAVEQGLLHHRPRSGGVRAGAIRGAWAPHLRLPLVLVGALIAGIAIGHGPIGPSPALLTFSLYLLLALVGYDLRLTWGSLRTVSIPIGAAIVSALAAAGIAVILLGIPLRSAFATSLAFGWYTLAGPLVTHAAGPSLGLLAFLTNFLRENFTMLSAPWAGRRLRAEGLAAMGGATAMDTTLYFIVRYGDPEAGGLALSSGLVLTVAASLLVPLTLGLPGG